MAHKVGVGDRSRIDGSAAGSGFQEAQKGRDEVGEDAVDVKSQGHEAAI
jgi:hypothetical protein